MKRILVIITITTIFVLFATFLLNNETNVSKKVEKKGCFYKISDNLTIYSLYCLEELADIPIIIEKNLSTKNYNVSIIFFDPLGRGYYSAALLELLLKIPLSYIPVCLYYDEKCDFYSLDIKEDWYYIADKNNKTYNISSEEKLIIFLLQNETNNIIIKENKIYIMGKDEGIRKAVSKFLLWWYGIANN